MTKTATFSMRREILQRIRSVAFSAQVSKSSIVELALRAFLDERTDQEVGDELRAHGASMRRRSAGVKTRH